MRASPKSTTSGEICAGGVRETASERTKMRGIDLVCVEKGKGENSSERVGDKGRDRTRERPRDIVEGQCESECV